MSSPNSNHRPKIITLESNIGSGKSTLLDLLEKKINEKGISAVAVQEPVDAWQQIGGENLLARFYEDPNRWAGSFQGFVLLSIIQKYERALQANPDADIVIGERSWYTCVNIFAHALHDSGVLSKLEWELYQRWAAYIYKNSPPVEAMIYLRTSPEESHRRMKNRGREEEKDVTLEYLQQLHNRHEEWLLDRFPDPGVPVLIIDVTPDYRENAEILEGIVSKILIFIDSITSA